MQKTFMLLLILVLLSGFAVAQIPGNALQFDGIDDFVFSSQQTSLGRDYTVEFWFYSDSMRGGLFHRGDSPYCEYEPGIMFLPTHELDVRLSGCGGSQVLRRKTLSETGWIHLALVVDSSQQYLYINGSLDTTGTRYPWSITAYHIVGGGINLGSGDATYIGKVDEVRIWDIPRTQAQIQSTMADTLGPEYYLTPDSGLVCYWRFDQLEDLGINGDGADDVRDLSVYGNHGDTQGNPTLIPVSTGSLVSYYPLDGDANDSVGSLDGNPYNITYIPDRFGNDSSAAYFDGTSSYIEIPSNSGFNYLHDGSDFSISLWLKVDTIPSNFKILSNTPGGDRNGIQLILLPTDSISFHIGRSEVPYPVLDKFWDNAYPPTNGWVHLAITYEASLPSNQLKLYVNGQFFGDASRINPHSTGNASDFMDIGKYAWGWTNFFNGVMDEIRFYNKPLTSSEISTIYHENGWPFTTPSISITSPNGGENWQVGTLHDITWSSTNVNLINIEYSTNNGGSWSSIATNFDATQGSFTWTVPNTPSANCLIKIYDTTNPAINDTSDGVFSITPHQITGWNYQGADREWSLYYPCPSTVTTSNNLVKKFAIAPATIDRRSNILTGDVNGDGTLELVYARDNVLGIYDGSGNSIFYSTNTISRGCLSLLADVNNNGKLEIGIGTSNSDYGSGPLNVQFFDYQGNLIKSFSKNGGYDAVLKPRAILPNGKLIAENNAGYSLDPRGWSLIDMNSGTELWYYDIGPVVRDKTSIADINNDGILEICGDHYTTHNGASGSGFNGNGTYTTDGDLWCIVIDENGNEIFSQMYPSPRDGLASHKFVDFNGSGVYRIVAAESHYPIYYHGTSQLHIFNALDGSTLFSFDGGYNYRWAEPLICDLNGDNVKEIITSNGYIAWSSQTQYIFSDQLVPLLSSTIQGEVVAGNDLNGDGNIEIVLRDSTRVKVLDSNLNLLDEFELSGLIHKMIISDLDNNGVNEIVVVADSIYSLEFGTTSPATDFSANLTVSDNCSNSLNLIFGTAPGATNGYDPGLDLYAPPPPPAGAFDARFRVGTEDFLNDYRATNLDTTVTWDVIYQEASGCSPATITWNPAQLPANGSLFNLVDFATGGSLVNVDMRNNSSYTDALGLGHLQIIYTFTVTINKDVMADWNMIGLPLQVTDPYYLSVFPGAIQNTLFSFNGTYTLEDTIHPCTGYWLRFPAAQTQPITGMPLNNCTITLNQGWNMIAGPYCNVALTDVGDPGGIIIPGTLFGFSGTYYQADTIKAGEGYWIRASASGVITVDCTTPLAKGSSGTNFTLPDESQFSQITISDAEGKSQSLFFNATLKDRVLLTCYSMPPLPPPGAFDARFAGDYRLTTSDEAVIELQASDFPLTFSFHNLNQDNGSLLEPGKSYVLQEVVDGKVVAEHNASEGTNFTITNNKVNNLLLSKVGTMPTVFAVGQNYPNPFNPTTTIKYAIPTPEKVTITIYNTLGQKVKTLVNKQQNAGYYKVVWDATNDIGLKVSSGIYFYVMKAGKHQTINKMLLVK